LGYSSDPPVLSTSIVRDLGTSFCKINVDSLTNEKLGSKPAKKGVVDKSKLEKPKKSDDGPEDGARVKKSKKK
jgi:hypothetical protein